MVDRSRNKKRAPHAVSCAAAALFAVLGSPASAADPSNEPANNRGTVELEVSGSAGAAVRIAEDLASIVNDGATRRVLPVIGTNARQTIRDLAMLRGIDMAVVQSDVMDRVRQQRTFDGIESGYTYIAKMYNEELHLLARSGVQTIGDLAGRKVNLDLRGSGTNFTASRMFDLLKIPVDAVNDGQEQALEKLRRGEIDAVAFVAAKPAPIFAMLHGDAGLHFLAIPLNPAVVDAYVPTTLTAADYPSLIEEGKQIDTIAVGTVLAVAPLTPGIERYRNVSTFVDVFFTNFRSLLEPGHHPKWREINLAAEAAGWRRFPPAQQWLDRNAAVARQSPSDVQALFSRFVETRQQVIGGAQMSDQQKQELFDQFQRWQSTQPR